MSNTDLADRIAAKHGCVILPGANGRTAVALLRQYEGQPGTFGYEAPTRALREIRAAGIDTRGWVL